jgi:hypothetical protein
MILSDLGRTMYTQYILDTYTILHHGKDSNLCELHVFGLPANDEGTIKYYSLYIRNYVSKFLFGITSIITLIHDDRLAREQQSH